MSSSKSTITAKLFIGFPLLPDLYQQLNRNRSWKQTQIAPTNEDLREIHYLQKKFLGYYLSQDKITLHELRLLDLKMRQALILYCPAFDSSTTQTQIFSQTFVS